MRITKTGYYWYLSACIECVALQSRSCMMPQKILDHNDPAKLFNKKCKPNLLNPFIFTPKSAVIIRDVELLPNRGIPNNQGIKKIQLG